MESGFEDIEKINVEKEKKKSLEQMIYEIGFLSSLFNKSRSVKGKKNKLSDLNLILEVLYRMKIMSISELCNMFPSTSNSTISTTITDLWKNKKLVNKNISPENQRVTLVDLTPQGKSALKKLRLEQVKSYAELRNALNLKPDEEETLRKIFDKAVIFFEDAIHLKK